MKTKVLCATYQEKGLSQEKKVRRAGIGKSASTQISGLKEVGGTRVA